MRIKQALLLLVFLNKPFLAQTDLKFQDHLLVHDLQLEHMAYLNSLSRNSDSTHYAYARYYKKYFDDSLLLHHVLLSPGLCFADTSFSAQLSWQFLRSGKERTRKYWFGASESFRTGKDFENLKLIHKASLDPLQVEAAVFPEAFRHSFEQYKNYRRKKPGVAAGLSVLVPGLGKAYAGKTRSFIFSFLICTAYAFQTYESAIKLGPTHAFTLINASAFGVFYASGIYGSYKAVIGKRNEYKKQFILDATAYYQ
ncbi:MAG TPA: hypothetical protein PLQ93_05500 [Bacteroidia bacterium]|nr:hypothetical protein [Bacteroidia bacterium]